MTRANECTLPPSVLRPFQFSMKKWIFATALFAVALAFPQFALFAPTAIVFSLIMAATMLVTIGSAYLIAGDPKPIVAAAWRNLLSLFVLNAYLLLYIAYAFSKMDFSLD